MFDAFFGQRASSARSRAATLLVWGALSVLFTGCSGLLPKDGPTGHEVRNTAEVRVEDTGRLSYAFVKLTPLVLSSLQTEPQPPVLFSELTRFAPAAQVRVGPADKLTIAIYEAGTGGLFFPAEVGARTSNSVVLPIQELDREGNVSVPYGGSIKALGRTPNEIARAIEVRLKDRVIEPQVVVTVGERASNTVAVLGDVNAPKTIALPLGGLRLLSAVAQAGGSRTAGYETIVTLQRKGHIEQALLTAIARDPRQNIELAPGDVIYVSQQPRVFLVFGATPTLGTGGLIVSGQTGRRFSFDAENLTLAEALARAGGLESGRADTKSVFLFRYASRENLALANVDVSETALPEIPTVFTVDLSEAEGYFLANSFFMKHKDVIFISDAPTVDLLKFLTVIDGLTGTARGAIGVGLDARTLAR